MGLRLPRWLLLDDQGNKRRLLLETPRQTALISDREELARLILTAALEKIAALGLEAKLGLKIPINLEQDLELERIRFYPAGERVRVKQA